MTIVEFLTARLDEDEAAARRCAPGPWEVDGEPRDRAVFSQPAGITVARGWLRDTDHMARHDPARVLAQVAAMRAIVDYLEEIEGWGNRHPYILERFAAIWAVHPDYDPAWAVDGQ